MDNLKIYKRFKPDNKITLYNGDCLNLLQKMPDESIDVIITSPPYCMKKEYENPHDDINMFRKRHLNVFTDIYRILKPGGSICWQVGYHISNTSVIPLDYIIYEIFTENSQHFTHPLILKNRIIWCFGHGLNSTHRFSGRHETILWFTKGNEYTFNLDSIRVPQKYPGKRSYKGPNKGNLSGHPLGKNPSDVWEIPNVKARHIEKTEHPCQFPVAIPQRLIKALVPCGGLVFDPFMGSGTTGIAAIINKCRFVGAEIENRYYDIATGRINQALTGEIDIREDVPVIEPDINSSVAKLPDIFHEARISQ
ncbi:MAG: site-specific DNA-methyltransferase [Defluviitaleaceae bacterium]|nr:site-specific DNA-methyltransferase [Defluviitaleaceae bacterium]